MPRSVLFSSSIAGTTKSLSAFVAPGKFRLREVASLDLLGIRSHGCPWCHTDLTDSIRAHLYDCAMLPVEVRRRAQAAREAARSLVKQSHQLSDAADVLLREAEAALHALRDTIRQAPTLSAISETKHHGGQIRLLSYHVLPMHLQVGDRFFDERPQAARVSTLASGELISPPRWRIGRGSLTSASA